MNHSSPALEPGQKLFVLDTNVLMHDPTALFRFHEHSIYLPMTVLEELDKGKKGVSEVARNVRQVNRFLDELLNEHGEQDLSEGIDISLLGVSPEPTRSSGKLFFETTAQEYTLPDSLPGSKNDNSILATVNALHTNNPEIEVILVSKDINLRIKATVLGLNSEDFTNDQVLEDVDLLFTGHTQLDADFWQKHSREMESWQEDGHTYYEIKGPEVRDWSPNQFVWLEEFEAVVRSVKEETALIEVVKNYQKPRQSVWGIHARNPEQNYALNLLMDPDVDFVSLCGTAGTGKTLLTLAAGLAQTMDMNRYREIIMTRVTVPVGEDIGFLPGTEEEKMTPWMGALMDNLEVLTGQEQRDGWEKDATNDLLRNRVKIRSLNFMRGRTFLNRFIILDEAQNLTSKQMKTLITRAGPGSKIVCLGNLAQIDTPYLTETTSGLTYAVDRFKNWAHSGHITLLQGERSRLADYASEML